MAQPENQKVTAASATARVAAFGVGCAKSGTHSLAAMFEESLRAEHEPAVEKLLRLVLRLYEQKMTFDEFETDVKHLFAGLKLDLNVSQVNGFIVRALVRFYPKARFVLTVRDCKSWLNSIVNYQIAMRPLQPNSAWFAFRDLRFRRFEYPHTVRDAPLRNAGLYSLDAYLSYWMRHNAGVIEAVPPEQLLIVPMKRLKEEAGAIAAFLGHPAATANPRKSHEHAVGHGKTPLGELHPGYLAERLDYYEQKLLEAAAVCAPARSVSLLKKAIAR
jgi:hypothetical protein